MKNYSDYFFTLVLIMLILFSAIAFFYAYLSFQDNKMISFYIALFVGIVFIGLMVNNVIQVNKMNSKKQ